MCNCSSRIEKKKIKDKISQEISKTKEKENICDIISISYLCDMLMTPLNLTLVYKSCHVQEKKCQCQCRCKSIPNKCGKRGCKCKCQLIDESKFYREKNNPFNKIDNQSDAITNGLQDGNEEAMDWKAS